MTELLNVLQRPLVTEKITKLQDKLAQFAFAVSPDANKISIKAAVEKRFNVKVVKVRTMRVQGKIKRLGRFSGRQSSWKKAIVTLEAGQKIDFIEGA